MVTAERHGIVKGTAGLNQPNYFKDVLTLKWNLENVLHWERGYAFDSIGNEKLWIPSKLIDTRFDWGRPPENFGYSNKEINLEKLQER